MPHALAFRHTAKVLRAISNPPVLKNGGKQSLLGHARERVAILNQPVLKQPRGANTLSKCDARPENFASIFRCYSHVTPIFIALPVALDRGECHDWQHVVDDDESDHDCAVVWIVGLRVRG